MTNKGITTQYEREAEEFYKKLLKLLVESKLKFVIGGTYAMRHYTGIDRPTKDIDIFCKAGDYPLILKTVQTAGYKIEIKDERWLARIVEGKYFTDIIFGSIPGIWTIDDAWIQKAPTTTILGSQVKVTPPEELIISKVYRMRRSQFDGADVTHIMLKKGGELDWKYLMNRMEAHWELLLVHIMLFRFVYPSERNIVPAWVMKELMKRIQLQLELPQPEDKISRGAMLSPNQYEVGWKKWGFKNITEFTTVI